MFRRSAFVTATLFFLAANLSAAQDTVPASEILKVWEKTAINEVQVNFEQTYDFPIVQGKAGPSFSSGEFLRSGKLGMRMTTTKGGKSSFNLLNGKGVSYEFRQSPIALVQIDPAGKTRIENSVSTEMLLAWLEPTATIAGKELRDLRDTTLEVKLNENSHRRATFISKSKVYTLAEEFDWRVVHIAEPASVGAKPFRDFEYHRAADKSLQLVKCEQLTHDRPDGIMHHSVFTMKLSEIKLDSIAEDDLKIDLPSPSRVIDNTVDPKRVYLLEDGSEFPFTLEQFGLLRARTAGKDKKPDE